MVGDLGRVIKESQKGVQVAEEKTTDMDKSSHFHTTMEQCKDMIKTALAVEVRALVFLDPKVVAWATAGVLHVMPWDKLSLATIPFLQERTCAPVQA